jgi:hypothetical protein
MDATGFEPVTPTVSRWCATPTLCVPIASKLYHKTLFKFPSALKGFG